MAIPLDTAVDRSGDGAAQRMSRRSFLAAISAIALLNGLASKIIAAIDRSGVPGALTQAFEVSAIVWLAAAVAARLLWLDRDGEPARRGDFVIGGLVVALALAPSGLMSWVALTVAAAWTLATTDAVRPSARAARILLAITVPMCWTKLLFSFAADKILAVDAVLTGALLNSDARGNLVEFPDGSGYFQIYPACSSFVNVSLALLAWVLAVNVFGRLSLAREIGWGAVACLAVVALNVARLVAIGLFPQHFELIHGPFGAQIANMLTLLVVACVCAAGVSRRGAPALA